MPEPLVTPLQRRLGRRGRVPEGFRPRNTIGLDRASGRRPRSTREGFRANTNTPRNPTRGPRNVNPRGTVGRTSRPVNPRRRGRL